MQIKLVVTDLEEKVRLDKYLSDNTEFSRNKIQKLMDNNNILVNGKNTKNSYKLSNNDEITIIDDDEEINIKAE